MGNLLHYLRGSNFIFSAFCALIVAMVIFPLPAWMIDSLVSTSIISAFVLFMSALYIKSVTQIESLPVIVLFMCFYRLALSIATTRQILSGGDAGAIITAFGEFIIGGNVVVGLVVFMIITVVQFMVISKGAERVAEVSARFTLDAIPGKQMSIDSELRNGTISSDEATELRLKLEVESKFYGAMDGALKFVKGDSIAGLIIVMVNLVGGFIAGMFMLGMSAAEAFSTFALLTIGDGLAGQVPAIFTSLACGVVISRVDARFAISQSIQDQMFSVPQALQLAAVFSVVFALIPGFPVLQFLVLAGLLAFSSYRLLRADWGNHTENDDVELEELIDKIYGNISSSRHLIVVRAGDSIDQEKIEQTINGLEAEVLTVCKRLCIPRMRVEGLEGFHLDNTISVKVGQLVVYSFVVKDESYQLLKIDDKKHGEKKWRDLVKDAVSSSDYGSYCYATPEGVEALKERQVTFEKVEDIYSAIRSIVVDVLERQASNVIGLEEAVAVNRYMHMTRQDIASVVSEKLSLKNIADVLKDHLDSRLSLSTVGSIYEALADEDINSQSDTEVILSRYRYNMKQEILAEYSRGTMRFALAPVSNVLIEYSQNVTRLNTHGEISFIINPEIFAFVRKQIAFYLDSIEEVNVIMVVTNSSRKRFRAVLHRMGFNIPVVEIDELLPGMSRMAKAELGNFGGNKDVKELVANNGHVAVSKASG